MCAMHVYSPRPPSLRSEVPSGHPAQRLVSTSLEAAAETEHKVERRLLLDVVVRERTAVLQLLAGEDEALLVGRDALLVLNFLLHVVDRVARLDVERDGLAREGLDENLRGRGRGQWVARVQ